MIHIKRKPGVRTTTLIDGIREEHITTGEELITSVNVDSLIGADLSHLDLSCANFHGSVMRAVNLASAILNMADMQGSDLTDAFLTKASLMGANLMNAVLTNADLSETILAGAKLQGADLSQAKISMAVLKYARYDDHTLWPENFSPQERGAKLCQSI